MLPSKPLVKSEKNIHKLQKKKLCKRVRRYNGLKLSSRKKASVCVTELKSLMQKKVYAKKEKRKKVLCKE